MRRSPILFLTLSLTLSLTAWCAMAAQPLPPTEWADPTRPAGAVVAAEAGAPRILAASRAASAAPAAAPQLQSVQLGANGQASALVDGRLLQPGDALGAARIVAIDADGLTLRDTQGRSQRLRLISPAIAKQAATGPAGPALAVAAAVPGAAPTLPAGPATPGREGQTQ